MTSVLRGDKACAWYFAKKKSVWQMSKFHFQKKCTLERYQLLRGKLRMKNKMSSMKGLFQRELKSFPRS